MPNKPTGRPCPDCNGNGYVYVGEHEVENCKRCQGSGIIQDQEA